MDTEKDYVGEVDGGLMSPDMVTENVWIAINDDVELISVRVILFYVKLTEQTGNYLIPEPEMFASGASQVYIDTDSMTLELVNMLEKLSNSDSLPVTPSNNNNKDSTFHYQK